jgi:cyclopropane fatty-acyl-phospholipid synthase-like methyltransferase
MKLSNPLGLDLFEVVLFVIEFMPHIVTFLAALYFVIPKSGSGNKATSGAKNAVLLFLPVFITMGIATTVIGSWEDAYVRGYEIFKYPSLRAKLENYIETGEGDLHDILESGKYAPTFGWYEVRYMLRDLVRHAVIHSNSHNEDNIDEGYNRGNDWFRATLGETMVYTSGIYPTGKETLTEAQNYKIDYVADAIQLKPGEKVLDIGCGWGYVTNRLTEKYGANVTGVTLSKDQLAYGTELNKNNGAQLLLQDAMRLKERDDVPHVFDKIISLEMAEHVGIRRYQEFLTMVNSLLKDDGVFYMQVAGLRRTWRYEDLVWGLFMGEHVFPGADASCPLGWVSTQIERAGFEIQRVHNMGSQYSRTLAHWLEEWRSNKDYVEKKYGAPSYRRWEVFLASSVRVARQGSSTVFMITLTKAGNEPQRIETQAHVVPKYIQYKPDVNSEKTSREIPSEVIHERIEEEISRENKEGLIPETHEQITQETEELRA